jgi:hypothetical protein
MFYIHRCSVSKSYSNAYPEKLRPPGLCLIQPSGYSQSVNAFPVDKRGGGLNFRQRLSTGEWSHRPDNASMTGDRQRKGIYAGVGLTALLLIKSILFP